MAIIAFLILGLLAGWIAGLIMGHGGYGIFRDIALGILGAIVGGLIGSILFGVGVTGLNIVSLILAVIGAIILIALWRALVEHRPIRG